MLHANGKQAVHLFLDLVAVSILVAHTNMFSAFYFFVVAGNR